MPDEQELRLREEREEVKMRDDEAVDDEDDELHFGKLLLEVVELSPVIEFMYEEIADATPGVEGVVTVDLWSTVDSNGG